MSMWVVIPLGIIALASMGLAGLALGILVGKREAEQNLDSYKANLAAMLGYDLGVEDTRRENLYMEDLAEEELN